METITSKKNECSHKFFSIYRHPTSDVKCAKCGKVMTHIDYMIFMTSLSAVEEPVKTSEFVVYKVRNNKTGLFSLGGMDVKWSKKGKIWANRGALSNHFALLSDKQLNKEYADCEVVEVISKEIASISVAEYVEGVKERRDKREKLREDRIAQIRKDREYKEFLRLQEKYGNLTKG